MLSTVRRFTHTISFNLHQNPSGRRYHLIMGKKIPALRLNFSPFCCYFSLRSSWTLCAGDRWGEAKTICLSTLLLSSYPQFSQLHIYSPVQIDRAEELPLGKIFRQNHCSWLKNLGASSSPKKGSALSGREGPILSPPGVSLLEVLPPFYLPLQI